MATSPNKRPDEVAAPSSGDVVLREHRPTLSPKGTTTDASHGTQCQAARSARRIDLNAPPTVQYPLEIETRCGHVVHGCTHVAYESISIAFEIGARLRLDAMRVGQWADEPMEPRWKDYDELEGKPTSLARRFDMNR
jgi:hypothetical protein